MAIKARRDLVKNGLLWQLRREEILLRMGYYGKARRDLVKNGLLWQGEKRSC